MTGDNHLTEIESCYNGSTNVVKDVETAITKINYGYYITGFTEIGLIIKKFPKALTSCKNLNDDIADIESWATIFTQPKELAETLSKNWLLQRRTIKEYLTNESTDWASGNYFQAGVDTALAMTKAVGPIKTNNESNLNDKINPEFVAGLVFGITGYMQLGYIS